MMKRVSVIMLLSIIIFSCTPCRKINSDTGYMVWIQEGIKKNYDCVECLEEANAYIFKVSGLKINTDSLIGKHKPYLHIDNGDYDIYVERESSWKKKGK